MANDIPPSSQFSGLSRKVLEYSEQFNALVQRIKTPQFSEADWAPLEALVDVERFVRHGVFLTDKAEVIDWPTYRTYVSGFGGSTHWEGTLRHITEQGNRVVLELEERNTRDGFTHIANTVTCYGFDDRERIQTLDVYVMSLNSPE